MKALAVDRNLPVGPAAARPAEALSACPGFTSPMHGAMAARVSHVSRANAYHAWDLEPAFQTFIVAIKDRLHRRPEERSP